LKFAKAHGLGNDFILVEAALAPASLSAWGRRLCERHLGVGGDGVVLYEVSPEGVRMRLLNADGSDAEISGNGLRCLAGYLVGQGKAAPSHTVVTAAGPRTVEVAALGATRYRVVTGLGPPVLASDAIPVRLAPPAARVVNHPLVVDGRELRVTATSLGNPHCAVFVAEPLDDALVAQLGAALEGPPFFPNRTNVEFVTVVGRGEIRVRFFERGVGLTRASGTGSASAAVASILNGLADRQVLVVCDGGTLEVEWPEGGPLRQTGDVEVLFEGDWRAS
jgi:diaminopimelate epimerase